MPVTVPKGKKVIIYLDGTNIMEDKDIAPGLDITLDQEVSLGLSSTFTEFFESQGSAGLDFAGSFARGLTGGKIAFSSQMKEFGFQYWRKSDPINFTLNLNFYTGKAGAYDAYKEVMMPMMKLASLCLPTEGGTAGTLISPGPSSASLVEELFDFDVSRKINIILGGVIRLYNIIIKRAEPTFSKEVDTRGYPISGTINLEVASIFNATTNMINVPRSEMDFNEFTNKPEGPEGAI